jgi:hypothetical protein
VRPFEKFSKPVRALIEREAASLGNFLGVRSELKFANRARHSGN